jgi:hypothetical protein
VVALVAVVEGVEVVVAIVGLLFAGWMMSSPHSRDGAPDLDIPGRDDPEPSRAGLPGGSGSFTRRR